MGLPFLKLGLRDYAGFEIWIMGLQDTPYGGPNYKKYQPASQLKADQPHPHDYRHTPTDDRHTDKHFGLVMTLLRSLHTHTDSGDISPTRTCVPYVLLAIV